MGGCSLEAVRGLLIAAASLMVEPRLKGAQASVIMAPWALERDLSSSGAGVSLFCGMEGLPRPGIELLSPVQAGGFFATDPPGQSPQMTFSEKGETLRSFSGKG